MKGLANSCTQTRGYSTVLSAITEPAVRQGEAAQHSARSTCRSKPLGQDNRKGDADKEKPVREEWEGRIKDKGPDFLAAIYDPKFFWQNGGARRGGATVLLRPSYSGLLIHSIYSQVVTLPRAE